MELIRIGDKLVSLNKIHQALEKMLDLRVQGLSQQEVARRLNLDRALISRLEKLGEVRKGSRMAVVGFPIANKDELIDMLQTEGVDYWLLMTDRERYAFASGKNGLEFFQELMRIVDQMRTHDVVIVLGSDYRIKLSAALLDKEVVGVVIGESPITSDIYVDPERLRALIKSLTLTGLKEAGQ